jgi:hypothetical protein
MTKTNTASPTLAPDSTRLLMTPEESKLAEAEERERLDRSNAELGAALAGHWTCSACGIGNSFAAHDGLCNACRGVVARLRTDRAAADMVNGRQRVDWCSDYLTRREA